MFNRLSLHLESSLFFVLCSSNIFEPATGCCAIKNLFISPSQRVQMDVEWQNEHLKRNSLGLLRCLRESLKCGMKCSTRKMKNIFQSSAPQHFARRWNCSHYASSKSSALVCTLCSYSVHSTLPIKGSELNYEITPCALRTALVIIARDFMQPMYADSGTRLRSSIVRCN